jgi:hypothetical protein
VDSGLTLAGWQNDEREGSLTKRVVRIKQNVLMGIGNRLFAILWCRNGQNLSTGRDIREEPSANLGGGIAGISCFREKIRARNVK